ncbi:MAG: AI-2E family transporter, partial [Pyrinomonadaceae bacterium]
MSEQEETKDIARTAARAAAQASWPQTRVVLRVIIIVLAMAVTIWIILRLTGVILLLILSVFFAYLVSPLVDFLRRPIRIKGRERAMPRVVAVSLAYLVIVGAIITAFYILVPHLGNQFPEFAQQARGYWRDLGASSQRLNDYLRPRMPASVMEIISRETPVISEKISGAITVFLERMLG